MMSWPAEGHQERGQPETDRQGGCTNHSWKQVVDIILWTGAALYARYRFLLISNKLYDWTVAQVGEGASGYVLSEWGVRI